MKIWLFTLILAGCGQALVDFPNGGGSGGGGGGGEPDLSVPEGADLAVAEVDLAEAELDLAGIDGSAGDLANNHDLAGADLTPPSCPAVRFSADATQVVSVADNALHDPAGAFTVEAWVYLTASANHEQVILGHWNPANAGGPANKREYRLYLDGTRHVVFGVNFTAIGESSATSAGTVPLNQWAHVAGVFQPGATTSTVTAFLDGTGASTSGVLSIVPANSDFGLTLGNYPGAGGALVGYLSHARLETGALYTANFTPAPSYEADANTLALYKFVDGMGSSASDSSSHGLAGALQNGAAYGMPPACR